MGAFVASDGSVGRTVGTPPLPVSVSVTVGGEEVSACVVAVSAGVGVTELSLVSLVEVVLLGEVLGTSL